MGSWKRRSVSSNRFREGELEIGTFLYPEAIPWRPKIRADCAQVIRPCPYVGCRYHLYLDVDDHDNVRTAPGEPWDRETSCALDVADEGGMELSRVAELLDVTKERVRQIEARALYRLRKNKITLRIMK